MNVTTRIKIERQIVRKIVTDAIAAGYFVSVHNGEALTVKRSNDVKAVMAETMTVDEEHLVITSAAGVDIGWVFLVYGNDGWDVVNDYTTSLTTLMDGVDKVADRLEARYA